MLKIENFGKDEGLMLIWGWDLLQAYEDTDMYNFLLGKRSDNNDRVYITLSRVKQYSPSPYYPEKRYQVYISDDNGDWSETLWLSGNDIQNYHNFLSYVEEVLEKNCGHA